MIVTNNDTRVMNVVDYRGLQALIAAAVASATTTSATAVSTTTAAAVATTTAASPLEPQPSPPITLL